MTVIGERGTDFILHIPSTTSGGGGGGDLSQTFETISQNLKDYGAAFAMTGEDIDTITYDLGGGLEIVKTFNYTGEDIASLVLSGDVPGGINLTKTFTYSGENIASYAYS